MNTRNFSDLLRNNEPRFYPLMILLVGTTLWAIPAALGTFALLDTSASMSLTANYSSGQGLLVVSVAGFVLFFGYIVTAFRKKHSALFWLLSLLYNAGLSLGYFYLALTVLTETNEGLFMKIFFFFRSGFFILPAWTIFVCAASFYYLKFPLGKPDKPLP